MLFFLAGAAYLLVVPEKSAEIAKGVEEAETVRRQGHRFLKVFATAFAVILIGEFGDLTQLLTINLVAKYHQPLSVGVFVGAFAGACMTVARRFDVPLPGGSASSPGGAGVQLVRRLSGVLLLGFAAYGIYSLVDLMDRSARPVPEDPWLRQVVGLAGPPRFHARRRGGGAARRAASGRPRLLRPAEPPGACLVEIGAWCGKSTLYLGAGRPRPPAPVLFSIDHHRGSGGEPGRLGAPRRRPGRPRRRPAGHPAPLAAGGGQCRASSRVVVGMVGDSHHDRRLAGDAVGPSVSSRAATEPSRPGGTTAGWAPLVAPGGWPGHPRRASADPADGVAAAV